MHDRMFHLWSCLFSLSGTESVRNIVNLSVINDATPLFRHWFLVDPLRLAGRDLLPSRALSAVSEAGKISDDLNAGGSDSGHPRSRGKILRNFHSFRLALIRRSVQTRPHVRKTDHLRYQTAGSRSRGWRPLVVLLRPFRTPAVL